MIIYLTGIDGSGKTALITQIEEHLAELGIESERIWARYSPKLARFLVRGFKKRTISHDGDYNKISASEYNEWQMRKKKLSGNKIVKFTLLTLFSIDYLFQILPVLRKLRAIDKQTVIIDRFVIDFLADQTVNFGDLSDTLIYKRFIRICNQFDAVLFISVRPEVALSRKKDIPGITYLKERDKVYRDIIKELTTGYIIDNNGPFNNAIKTILKIMDVDGHDNRD